MSYTLPPLNFKYRTEGLSQYDTIPVSDDLYERVLNLALKIQRPILELEADDFEDHGCMDLLASAAAAAGRSVDAPARICDPLIHSVYERAMARMCIRTSPITGGRVLVVSPHPDDDVISAGATIGACVDAGCEVHVAYATTGSSAVYEEDVRCHFDFLLRAAKLAHARALPGAETVAQVAEFLANVDAAVVGADVRTAIRETEAISALGIYGLPADRGHFMRLPFYDAPGRVPGPADLAAAKALLLEIRPTHILIAADLADPHGTHATVYELFREAITAVHAEMALPTSPLETVAPQLRPLIPAPPAGALRPLCWLYRGAWQDWPVTEATAFVVASRSSMERKLLAMWRHESQKQVMPFGGEDDREFYARALDRNTELADTLCRLGMPSVYAAEGLVAAWEPAPAP